MIINPIFLWGMFILCSLISGQFVVAKEFPMAVVWGGAAITEGGYLWYVIHGGGQ